MTRSLTLAALVALLPTVGCASAPPAMRIDRSGYDYAAAGEAPIAGVVREEAGFFDDDASDKAAAPPPPPAPPAPPLPSTTPEPQRAPETPEKPVEAAKRLVIYTGSMSLMVPVAEDAADTFVDKVNGLGGYLQARSATTVTVRVPAASFFAVLRDLRLVGTVTDEQVNAQDVTKKVFDTELRLQTAEESRKRLVEILKAATKIEDILRIETEIRRLTDEIEAMKGDLRNLADQIAFSTLTVAFFANAPAPRPYPDRSRSRFEWINQIGVEQVLYGF